MGIHRKILLTGATGYVGGKLLKRLEALGHEINCLARDPHKINEAGSRTQIFRGDVRDRDSMTEAFEGVDTAYYLIHSLSDKKNFEQHEKEAARNFADAARVSGVKRIIYLGGLGNEAGGLSPHLQSRQDVGRILRSSGLLTIELRASIVLGAGSLSFEMIRALTEHLPFMVMPKWVSVKAQPIGIRDLLDYLVQSMDLEVSSSQVLEIGGADRVSYRELMEEYALQRGLKRTMVPIPLLTPWLSSHWLGLITPLYAAIGRKLIESIRNPTVVEDYSALQLFDIKPGGIPEAIAEAISAEQEEFAQPDWLEKVLVRWGSTPHRVLHDKNRLIDHRCTNVASTPDNLFKTVSSIGGSNGMFACSTLWGIRAWLDRLAGGGNIQRPRTGNEPLAEGDAVDFFRIEHVDPNRRIRLKTDMKLPGSAWLEFLIQETDRGTQLHHAVIYEPKGFSGRLYWLLTYPAHAMVFRGMHKAIMREAEKHEEFPGAIAA
ncbi:hypothetical protein PDESU_05584 [Pontiella desulfatans]|uniref:NAD(P)-binding domain-containing protein n=1 Tax=Pontiella desulfatans TaxID=2750659 RepID=A0A6C2UAC7_PONDE|nr:SDR family oxidoreductase [Pontiella desulfatans]VGO16990.1 hypothetical protein PDESU_05584 [Pontiella desulfatans]